MVEIEIDKKSFFNLQLILKMQCHTDFQPDEI